jgi:hypothetical protein
MTWNEHSYSANGIVAAGNILGMWLMKIEGYGPGLMANSMT